MLSQGAISRLELHVGASEADTLKVHPEMTYAPERLFLFDEAFFAYREDAELSFRAQCLGIKVWYEPSAVALHVRKQRGAGRAHEVVNSLSVKNRFLLQALYSSWSSIFVKLCTSLRNCIVVSGVYLFERSSLPALANATLLRQRASLRRKELARRNPQGLQSLSRWFYKEYE
jgi:GT2 family glycosyltransferase